MHVEATEEKHEFPLTHIMCGKVNEPYEYAKIMYYLLSDDANETKKQFRILLILFRLR